MPLSELKDKLLYKYNRIICRETKVIKGLLVRKLIRKLQELHDRKEPNQIQNESKLALLLDCLKNVDHSKIGTIMTSTLSIGSTITVPNISEEENEVLRLFQLHRRSKDIMSQIEAKISLEIQRNNSLRSKEQKENAKKKKLSDIITKRRLGLVKSAHIVYPISISILL